MHVSLGIWSTNLINEKVNIAQDNYRTACRNDNQQLLTHINRYTEALGYGGTPMTAALPMEILFDVLLAKFVEWDPLLLLKKSAETPVPLSGRQVSSWYRYPMGQHLFITAEDSMTSELPIWIIQHKMPMIIIRAETHWCPCQITKEPLHRELNILTQTPCQIPLQTWNEAQVSLVSIWTRNPEFVFTKQ